MDILNFVKQKWNLALGVAIAIVVILTDFIIPPDISFSFVEGQINFNTFSRFIVAGILLILLVPCTKASAKNFTWIWWVMAVTIFAVSILLFFSYNRFLNQHSAYNRYHEKRMIIGETTLPLAQKAIDSVIRADQLDNLTPGYLLETLGEPTDIWLSNEIAANGNGVILRYILTITSFSMFILFSIQALYCTVQGEGKTTRKQISVRQTNKLPSRKKQQ